MCVSVRVSVCAFVRDFGLEIMSSCSAANRVTRTCQGSRWDRESETRVHPLSTAHPHLPVQGNFEVTVNGDLIWSKRTIENHGFPMTEAQVRARTHPLSTPLIKHTHPLSTLSLKHILTQVGTIFDAVRARQKVRVSPTTAEAMTVEGMTAAATTVAAALVSKPEVTIQYWFELARRVRRLHARLQWMVNRVRCGCSGW